MKSLRAKVFIGVLAGLLLVVAGAEALLYRQTILFAEKALFDSLKRYANALNEIVYLDSSGRLQVFQNWENRLKFGLEDRAEYFEFKTSAGQFITDSHNLGGDSLPEAGDGGYRLVDYGNVLLGVYEQHFSLTSKDKTQQYVLLVANNTGLVSAARQEVIRTFMLFTPVVVMAAFLISLGLTAIILASISRFTARVLALEESDSKTHLDLNQLDSEMKPLGLALNKFIDQINLQLVSESRVLADTAHELYTPLVSMRDEINQLKDSNLPQKQQRLGLNAIEKGLNGLQRMTDNMLLLHRIESGKYHPRLSLLDLQGALKNALKKPPVELDGDGLEVSLQGDPIKVCGNRSVLKLIIQQLMNNAASYAPGSPVTISWQQVEEDVLLHVDDNGRGIELAERLLVFDRLYRISDHAHQQPSGSGLGLSLVRLYAESINAKVLCLESPGGGARFTIWLSKNCPKPQTGSAENPGATA